MSSSRWCVPPGLVDPEVEVRPAITQVDDLLGEIKHTRGRAERVLVTTLTKRMSEDLTDYLTENGLKVQIPAFRYRYGGAGRNHSRFAAG